MKSHILLLWLFCAKASFAEDRLQVDNYETRVKDAYAGDRTVQLDDTLSRPSRSVVSDAENIHSADSNEEEIVLDENGKPRDKRTLALIVRGLASALGYTLTPLQVASLPNPSPPPPAPPAPKAPAPPPAPKAPIPAPPPRSPPSAAPPAKAPAPPPQPRQRETIRITGLVNFGANANSNLPVQLGQYEQLFHGNAAGTAPAPPPTQPPAPIPKPTLAKIPSPIVPNLSPLLPPSRPPISMPGSTPTKPGASSPMRQEVETEYRKEENFEKYNVDNKEIQGDRNVFSGSPGSAYVEGSDWRQGYTERLKELEERQKEYADRLKKHEALLVERQQDHENTDERFVNREKEIAERDKAYATKLRDRELKRERDDQKDEERSEVNFEDSRGKYEEEDKSAERYERPLSSESEEQHSDKYEQEEEKRPQPYSDHEDYPQEYSNYNAEDDKKLPISEDREISTPENVRNSYGESLEDQGKVDENIADYFAKFKDSKSGLYVPEKTQDAENYNKEKEPWWKGSQEDFDSRLEHLRNEYSSPAPESKYEEYELENGSAEDDNSGEKLEHINEADETTSRPKSAQKIPDYSEAFGGYEPYSKTLEPERNQEIIPPSVDTAGSPMSDSKQDSNVESEESQQSEDEKEIPLYHFDFKSFMPYYSPIMYVYDSDHVEPGIPRIQSYNHNAKASNTAESSQADLPVERKEPKEDHQPKIGLPEKLTMKNLHDGESKELRAWPAPFDYVFDSTEQTNVAELPLGSLQTHSGTEIPVDVHDPYSSEGLQATPIRYPVPEYDTDFRDQHSIRQQESEPESFHGRSAGTQNLNENPKDHRFYEYFGPSSALEGTSPQSQVPYVPAPEYNSQENDRQINHREKSPRNDINEQRDLQAPELQNQRHVFSDYPFVNHQRDYETNTKPDDGSSKLIQTSSTSSTEDENHEQSRHRYRPVESHFHKQITHGDAPISQNGPLRQFGPGNADLRNRAPGFNQNYTPAEPRLNGRRFDETSNHQLQQQDQGLAPHHEDRSSLKFEDPKSAHDFFGFSQNDYDYENNGKNEKSSQSLGDHDESQDLLVVSDPTPYQYDVKLTEFTDEPESDTEKVKVKEYRNKIATVTISEKKQLSPEGPVHLIGYSHQY